ncbi:unnamed protein product [Ascophyllum nodosum]
MENGQRRALLTILGVAEDGGSFVLLMGLVLVGLAALACFYCKVYDPVKVCCIKLYHRYKRGPRDEQAPPPERSPPPEREHWYLNRTLKIDRKDRDELGPVADVKGLQGGWYGARNGGFNV